MNATAFTDVPRVELRSLDELWFQVSGTLCNLECTHCFISCSPHNASFGYLSLETVERMLQESVALGVREYYFTGGEPFLNREIVPILERTLDFGPATVLTNGTVLKAEWLECLRTAEVRSLYSLEFRVSIDGPTPEINDPIRGPRTFERAMRGVKLLCEFGFLPIITMTRTWDEADDAANFESFCAVLKQAGCDRPRWKILPRLQIGAEANRTRGYDVHDRVTPQMMDGYDAGQLICSHSRVVTDRGIYVCPILLDLPDARLGDTLDEATHSFPLSHGACFTCYQYGAICTNPSSKQSNGEEDTPMQLAFFGGLYSNYLALEAAICDAKRRGAEQIYCLGDLGAFGPHPDRVFPLLRDAGVICIQGNYDDSVGNDLADCQCGYTDPRDNDFAQISYDYTHTNTSDVNRRWLRDLPKEIRFEIDGIRFLLCHGSPRRTNEFLWESTTSTQFLDKLADDYQADVILGTHTGLHWQRELQGVRRFINIGVLGRPENDGRTNVWYTMVSTGPKNKSFNVEFVPLEYDYERLAGEMRAERIPEEFTETICTGWWTTCLEVLPAKERRRGKF